jgi:hypothetical protein
VNLEIALERTTPTKTQWHAWTLREPSLAGHRYADVRTELRTGTQTRKDEILGALIRLAQADHVAFGVTVAALLPGLRHRAAQFAPGLDRQDALAIMVLALYEVTIGYETAARARFVAGRLLALPTRRLRRAAARERSWTLRSSEEVTVVNAGSTLDPSPSTMLMSAVEAGVLSAPDAQLILDTRIADMPLQEAARRRGLRYDAAKKRRQRAEARWIAWWLPDERVAAAAPDDRQMA